MNEDRFSFPLFINADFIPNSDRERINSDNPWNHYLFYVLGKTLVKVISEVASSEEPKYLNLLCKKILVSESQDTRQLVSAFNKGYQEALSQYTFILNDNSEKVSSTSIFLDESGLSEAIGHEGFYALIRTDKRLPHPNLDSKILKNELFDISKITTSEVVKSIEENIEALKQWIVTADDTRAKFFEWITQKKETKPLLEIVPAYQFKNEWKSHSEFTEKTIILSESTVSLRDDLEKLGFLCSSCLYEEHPFHDFITIPTKKKLFSLIRECDISSWSFEDRKGLFFTGPRNPSGSLSASDQVLPPSAEALVSPHHPITLGPAL